MNSEYVLQYRSMNVDHLLVDEIEYELEVRQVPFTESESRDVKKRKLRTILKEQRESNNFELTSCESQEECEKENQLLIEKIAKIQHQLESSKTKRVDLPPIKTRLIHLYFRVNRLKKNFDTEGLEAIALKLLNDYFSLLSADVEARKRTEETILDQMNNLSVREQLLEQGNDTEEQENSGGSEEDEPDPSVSSQKNKRRSALQKKTDHDFIESQEIFKKLVKHIDRYIESKLVQEDPLKVSGLSPRRPKKTNGKIKKEEKCYCSKKGKPGKISKKKIHGSDGESSDDRSNSEDDSDISEAPKRRPRSVADWKMKYDGKDEGKKLNKFIVEVEFMADAENMSKKALFKEAIHLFSGDARTWYIEGKTNRNFRSWNELVIDLKQEFQPPDMDFHYEQQAAQRRQRRSETFIDYYHAVMEIFDYMAIPPTEQRKFDIIFRNLRSDYKNALVIKGIRTLHSLKQWGKKLDSANMWMYRNRDLETGTNKFMNCLLLHFKKTNH
ncbi:uncharacterized protein LOC129762589 [Toxorhynchites rutilus septentrionalis]|uniref:uncharacterized protein LOC129762589 n=1 Tax=Toxorhynchites rutilus septentrionalis TaxID=329112 RepID=UPI002479C954|nr:uncharacterized protein LOC129762589 [Toxorhynchites rutilus septentrionalis]